MLFAVQYVSFEIEKVHSALEYFFNKLEEGITTFDENLFPEDFRPYLYKHKNSENGYKKFVRAYFEPIFHSYRGLLPFEKLAINNTFRNSNQIENICNNLSDPVHFTDIPPAFQDAIKKLIELYGDLNEIIEKGKDKDEFISKNGKICSICGLNTINPYDHYLPKGTQYPIYVYSAINSKNLIPICTDCNLSKSSKIIIFDNNLITGNRLVTFYPYEQFETWEYLNFNLTLMKPPTVATFGEWRVTININQELTPNMVLKINRWKIFFSIENLYSKEIRLKIENWLIEFKEIKEKEGITLRDMVATLIPKKSKIQKTPSLILEWLFFQYLENNAQGREIFLPVASTSVNPNDFLRAQGLI